MKQERFEKLEKLGMQWTLPEPWEYRYSIAQQYYKEHGNLEVPANYKVFYSINGVEYKRSNGGMHVISDQLPAGDYRMDMIFKGGGIYNPAYRTVTLRVSA